MLIASIISAGCASSVAVPVPVAQVGDETKSCDAIANEMQQMITAQVRRIVIKTSKLAQMQL